MPRSFADSLRAFVLALGQSDPNSTEMPKAYAPLMLSDKAVVVSLWRQDRVALGDREIVAMPMEVAWEGNHQKLQAYRLHYVQGVGVTTYSPVEDIVAHAFFRFLETNHSLIPTSWIKQGDSAINVLAALSLRPDDRALDTITWRDVNGVPMNIVRSPCLVESDWWNLQRQAQLVAA